MPCGISTVWTRLRSSPGDLERRLKALDGPLPEYGVGAPDALGQLASVVLAAAVRSSGPRYYHFVTGGTTPAELGADWLTSTADQNGAAWVCGDANGALAHRRPSPAAPPRPTWPACG